MRTLAAAIILATLAATCPAQQPDPTGDPLYVSDTVFPASRGWTLFSSTPSLSEKELASIKAQLWIFRPWEATVPAHGKPVTELG
jgi:glyoxylase-like metal-dependent hydrolase (beta-lactamase superfamily II)